MSTITKCANCKKDSIPLIFIISNGKGGKSHPLCCIDCAVKFIKEKKYRDYEFLSSDTTKQPELLKEFLSKM